MLNCQRADAPGLPEGGIPANAEPIYLGNVNTEVQICQTIFLCACGAKGYAGIAARGSDEGSSMAHRSAGNPQMVRPCLVTLRDGLWKMERSFDSLCSLPSTALRAGRMTMGSAALTTSSLIGWPEKCWRSLTGHECPMFSCANPGGRSRPCWARAAIAA